VQPAFRKLGTASEYADQICKLALEKGMKRLVGSVCPGAHGSTDSVKVLLSYGMSLDSATDKLIYFTKNL
jgi:hypothetical protein